MSDDNVRRTVLFIPKHSMREMNVHPVVYEFRMEVVFQHPDLAMENIVLEQLQHKEISEGGNLKDEIIRALKDKLAVAEAELERLRRLEKQLEDLARTVVR
jgi:hypothetical protein